MFPRWLSWLVFLALGYLIIVGNRAQRPELPTATPVQQEDGRIMQPAPQPEATQLPNTLPTNGTINEAADMERWKRAINPEYAKRAQCELKAKPGDKPTLLWKVTEDVVGAGTGAKCTDSVPLKLTVWTTKGEAAYTGDVTLALGAREIAAGLDAALIGLKPGGTRTVVLGPEALVRDKKSTAPKPLLNAIGTGRVVIVTAERIAKD